MIKFNEDHKDLIISCKEKEFHFSNFLEEEIEIEFSKYTLEDLPEELEGFSKDQIEILFKFINN